MRPVVAAIVVLLFPGTAAAATWSPPQHLSGAHTFVQPLSISTAGTGRTLAAWTFQDGLGNSAHQGAADASRAPGAAAFGSRHALPATVTNVQTYGFRGALQASVNAAGTKLYTRAGHDDGTFAKRRLIRRGGVRIVRPSLAVNSRGDAALAWFEDRGVRTDRVYVALRRGKRAFGRPRLLFTGRVRSAAAAIGPFGDVLVAWDARGVLKTRFKPNGHASFRKTDTIRSEKAFSAELHPVVAQHGRAVLAWSAQFLSEGGTVGPMFFEAAVRPAGAHRFRTAQLLERIDPPVGTERPIDAVTDEFGDVTVAWTGANGADRVVRAASMPEQSDAVGPPQDLGPGFLSDLAASFRGPGAAAVWDDGVDANPSSVHAAVADAGQTFGAAETVSPPGEDAHFGLAAFSFDGVIVLYAGRTEPTRFFVEASVRSG
jgi:hypothetical protein